MLNEISQAEKDNYQMVSLIYRTEELGRSVRERQIPHDFTRMWNLRNKTDEHGEGKEK